MASHVANSDDPGHDGKTRRTNEAVLDKWL